MATSYTNNGGTGERRPELVVSTNFTSSAGDLGGGVAISNEAASVMIDGVNNAGGREFGSANNTAGDRWIQFDWGIGARIIVDEFTLYLQTTTTFGSSFTWEGSNDATNWTIIGATFSLGVAGANVVARAHSVGYRYYRIRTTNFLGGAGGRWYEFDFKLLDVSTPINYPLLLRPGEVNPSDVKLFGPLYDSQGSHSSWYNSGGKGNRGSFITVTTDATLASGAVQNDVDGSYVADATHGFVFNAAQSGKYVRFDFGSGQSVVVDTISFWMGSNAAHGTWKAQGSNDATNWTDIGPSFTWGGLSGLNRQSLGDNLQGFRYWQVINIAGSTNGVVNNAEIEFRMMGLTSVQARTYKLSGYSVIVPVLSHVFKLNAYAVIKPFVVNNTQPVLIIITG